MSTTSAHDTARSPNPTSLSTLARFASIRGPYRTLFAALAATAAVIAIGSETAAVPTPFGTTPPSLPLWRLIAIGSGTLPALNLHSKLEQLEQPATRHHRRHEHIYLAIVTTTCLGLFLAGAALVVELELLPVAARGWFTWFGLALISGRVFGWQMSWLMPIIIGCLLIFTGGGRGGDYTWWEFTIQPASHTPTLILSLTTTTVGIIAYILTPWHSHRLRSIRSQQIKQAGLKQTRRECP